MLHSALPRASRPPGSIRLFWITISPKLSKGLENAEEQFAGVFLARTQESQGLRDRCEEERTLGQDFADEAQEWVTLAGNLSDKIKTLTAEAAEIPRLREVIKPMPRHSLR